VKHTQSTFSETVQKNNFSLPLIIVF